MIDYARLKFYGLDHYNVDPKTSFEVSSDTPPYHTIVIHFIKDKNIYCPNCGSFSYISRGSKSSELRFSTRSESNVRLKIYKRVFRCKDCNKEFREENPFTHGNKTITLQMEFAMLNDIRNNEALAFNKIAEKYGVSNTFLNDLFDKKVDLKRLPLPDVLSIDEVHAKKLSKTKFCCVLYDFMNRQIVDILDCRHKNFLIDYLSRITKKERNNVKFVSMDMWDTYRDVSKLCFPDAVIVCDSFHVIQKMGRDYTHLRVRIQNRFEKQDHTKLYYKLIKKYSTYLNMDESKLKYGYITVGLLNGAKMTRRQLIEYILKLDDELRVAYELRQEYLNFNSTATINNAAEWLDELIFKFASSNIRELEDFAGTLRDWHDEIVNSFMKYQGVRVNNGRIERKNESIKTIFRVGFGLSNFARTRNRVMFTLNPRSPILYKRKKENNNRHFKKRGPYKKKKEIK